jgi:hypothetical protein
MGGRCKVLPPRVCLSFGASLQAGTGAIQYDAPTGAEVCFATACSGLG